MARKTFLNGYPLPASDLNTYLMDQTVQTFADAAARTAALATPTAGMMSYLADTKQVYTYDGTTWNAQIDAVNQATVLPTRRNAIINGGFDIWQRGTGSFSGVSGYCADRWNLTSANNSNVQRVTLAVGSTSTYGAQISATNATNNLELAQGLEDSILNALRGQTVILSFYAYASTGTQSVISYVQKNSTANVVGGAGWSTVGSTTHSVTTTPQRFTMPALVIPADSTSAGLRILIATTSLPNGGNVVVYNVQLEAGSVATPFSRAGGTLQGELAACQRYYQRVYSAGSYGFLHTGGGVQTTKIRGMFPLKTTLRAAPTSLEAVGIYADNGATVTAPNATVFFTQATDAVAIEYQFTSGIVAGFSYGITGQTSSSYLAVSSEL